MGTAGTSWLSYAVARGRAGDPDFPAITAHSLRHTAASLAIHAGANVKVVQRMLGHASAAMTMDLYGHLVDGNLWQAARVVGGISGASEFSELPAENEDDREAE